MFKKRNLRAKEVHHTRHEIREVTKALAEDHVTMFRNTLLELLLEVAAAVLILAELRDLANKVL